MVTIVVPVVLFLLFKANRRSGALEGIGFTAATTMVGIAVYGAMLAATSGGAMVSIERAQGWSRQLRLTPLRPEAYIAIKIIVAMLLGLTSVAAVYVMGAINGVQMAPEIWIATGILAWAASLVFASFGLFMGYLLPSENVMQVIGPVLAVFALFGGLLVPLALLPFDHAGPRPLHADLWRRIHRPLPAGRRCLRSDLAAERPPVGRCLRGRGSAPLPPRHAAHLTAPW